MKKSTVRVFAIVLAVLMCLSLLPLTRAFAEEYVLPSDFPDLGVAFPGFADPAPALVQVGEEYVEKEHVYGQVVDEDYLVDPDAPGDCVTPATYWKSCINVNPYSSERCGVTAEASWSAAFLRVQTELSQRRANGEKADFEEIFKNAITELDAKYKFTVPAPGHQWVEVEHQEATCEQDGWDTYYYCAVCGEGLDNIPVIPATGHRYENGVCEVCGAQDESYSFEAEQSFSFEAENTAAFNGEPDFEPAEESVPAEETVNSEEVITEDAPAAEAEGESAVPAEEPAPDAEDTGDEALIPDDEGEEPYTEPAEDNTAPAQTDEQPAEEEPAAEPAYPEEDPEEPAAPAVYTGEVTVEQTDASEDVKDSFNEALSEQGYDNTVPRTVHNVTPYKEDGSELLDEEIPEDGLTLEMDLPVGFDPELQDLEVFHRNKNGEWEKMQIIDINVEGGKIVVHEGRDFYPSGVVNEQVGFLATVKDADADNAPGEDAGAAQDNASGPVTNDETKSDDEAKTDAESKTNNESAGEDESEVKNDTVEFKKEEASTTVVNSFFDAMDSLGLDAESTAILDVKDITPVHSSDESPLTDEEVAAMGGLDFVMDLPEDFDPANGPLEVYHFNEKTGEWEKMEIEVDLVNWKAIIKNAKSFSPFAFVSKKVGAVSPFGFNQKRLDPFVLTQQQFNAGNKGIPGLKVSLDGASRDDVVCAFPGDTLTVVLSDEKGSSVTGSYTYQWYRDDNTKIGSTTTSTTYPVTPSDINHDISCAVLMTDAEGIGHSARSNVYHVREGVTITFVIEGKGSVTIEETDAIEKEKAIEPVSFDGPGSITISTITENTLNITATPKADEGFYLREIGNTKRVSQKAESVKISSVPKSYDNKTVKIVFDTAATTPNSKPGTTNDVTDAQSGESLTALKVLVKELGLEEAAANSLVYVAPHWDAGASYMDEAEIASMTDGIDFELDYPSNPSDIKTTGKYDIRVYHYSYDDKKWDQVPAGQVQADPASGKILVKGYKSFSPFAVIAVPTTTSPSSPGTTITVSFLPGDKGTGTMAAQTCTVGTTATLNKNGFGHNNNYEPAGWRDQDGKGYAEMGSFIVPSKDLTLTAQWKQVNYTVTYDGAGGGLKTDAKDSETVAIDKSTTIKKYTDLFTEIPGKTFVEWNTKADGTGTSYAAGASKVFNEDVTLYAILKDTVKVYYNPGNRGMGSYKEFEVTVDTEFTLKTLAELEFTNAYAGEIFASWNHRMDGSGEDNFADGAKVTIKSGASDEERSFYAQWGEPVTVSFNANGGSGSMSSQEVAINHEATLKENEYSRSGYLFKNWNTQADGKGKSYTDKIPASDVTANITLYAQWIGPLTVSGDVTNTESIAYVGETLTAKLENVSDPSSVTYQWGVAEGNAFKLISGATSPTFTPSASYDGMAILCRVQKGDSRAYSSRKTVSAKLTGVTWKQDIINDGNTVNYPASTWYTQAGMISGVAKNMQVQVSGGEWKTLTDSDVKDGVYSVTVPGEYVFRIGGATSDPIAVYDWYVVGLDYSSATTTTSSGTTASSASGRAVMNRTTSSGTSGAMPSTPILANSTETQRENNDIMKLSAATTDIWAVKKGSTTTITLTVTPASGSYAHVYRNGTVIDNFGRATTSSSSSSSSASSSSASTSRTYQVSPVTAPVFYSVLFNNSATSPQTGDEAQLGLWSALCLVSLTGTATILGSAKKRKKN